MTQFERVNFNEQIALRDVYIPGLDAGIERAVFILRNYGIDTYQCCEGGDGHAYPESTVDFGGGISEGFRAYSVARTYGLPIKDLCRVWQEQGGELVGPIWRLTFWKKLEPVSEEERAQLLALYNTPAMQPVDFDPIVQLPKASGE